MKMNVFRFSAMLLLVISGAASFTSYCFTKKTVLIRGTVSYLEPYCGGAAPTPEIEARRNIPVPAPNFVLHFKKGSRNNEKTRVEKTVTANASGYFEVRLPKGDYCIVEDYKSKPFAVPAATQFTTWDTTCLKNKYNDCDFKLKVTGPTADTIKLVFRKHCFFNPPCGSYTGPLPPTAQPPRPPKGN